MYSTVIFSEVNMKTLIPHSHIIKFTFPRDPVRFCSHHIFTLYKTSRKFLCKDAEIKNKKILSTTCQIIVTKFEEEKPTSMTKSVTRHVKLTNIQTRHYHYFWCVLFISFLVPFRFSVLIVGKIRLGL